MFKKIVFILGVFIITSSAFAQNSPVIMKKWDALNKFEGNILPYCVKGCAIKMKYIANALDPDVGVLNVKILKNERKILNNIQLLFLLQEKIKKGEKYKIKISLQSNKLAQITAKAIMHGRPWSILAKKASVRVSLQANKDEEIIIEFIAEKNFNNVRIPCLFLGKLKQGTELNIKSVIFEKNTLNQ